MDLCRKYGMNWDKIMKTFEAYYVKIYLVFLDGVILHY